MQVSIDKLQSCMFCSGWFREDSKQWCDNISKLLDTALTGSEKPENLFFAYKYNKLSSPDEFKSRAKELANEEVRRAFTSQIVVFNRDDINSDLGTLIEFLSAIANTFHSVYIAHFENDTCIVKSVYDSDFCLDLENPGLSKAMLAAITSLHKQGLDFHVSNWKCIRTTDLPNTKTNMMIAALLDSKTVSEDNYE